MCMYAIDPLYNIAIQKYDFSLVKKKAEDFVLCASHPPPVFIRMTCICLYVCVVPVKYMYTFMFFTSSIHLPTVSHL